MATDHDFRVGRHEGLIESLSTDMAEVKASVARIENHLAEGRGERRVALWLAGSVGGFVSLVLGIIMRHFKI
jgi:hypothetical protein